MLKYILLIFILFLVIDCRPQSLIGLWKGKSDQVIGLSTPISESLEVITHLDTIISGIIHYYYKHNKFEHIKFKGKINWLDSTIVLIEEKVVSHNIDTQLKKIYLGTNWLNLSKTNDGYVLYGKWVTHKKIFLSRKSVNVRYYLSSSLYEATDKNSIFPKELNRQSDVQHLIELLFIESDSVNLAIYDNGEIDNDTASLYLNDSVIIKSKRLTQIPVQVLIKLDKKKLIHKIRLVAENLGSIPPNTALLVITTRLNKYVINLSSDFSKNGSVEFFLKE
jgi:hypothetical protein